MMKQTRSVIIGKNILQSAWFELVVLGLFVAIALLAPLISPYDPNQLDLSIRLQGFSLSHFLGTDALGRDVLSRLMFGARTSLSVASISICWGGAVGILLGLCSGYLGGWLDSVIANSSIPSSCYDAADAALAGENPIGSAMYFNTGSGKGIKIGAHQFY